MTVEEKSKEFYHKYRELNLAPESAAFNVALEMAEWKEQQMLEKAKNWFKTRLPEIFDKHNPISIDGIFEDFKQTMKEE